MTQFEGEIGMPTKKKQTKGSIDLKKEMLLAEIAALHEGIRKNETVTWQLRTILFGIIFSTVSLSQNSEMNWYPLVVLLVVLFLYLFDMLFQDLVDRQTTRRNNVRDALLKGDTKELVPFASVKKTSFWNKLIKLVKPGWYRLVWYTGVCLVIGMVFCMKVKYFPF